MTALVRGRSDKETIIEEHVVRIQEPGTLYLGHTTSNTGYASDIKKRKTLYLRFLAGKEVIVSFYGCSILWDGG